MKKRLIAIGMALMLSGLSLTGCRIGNTEFVLSEKKMDHKTVFTVDDMSCTVREAAIYLCNYRNIYGNVYGVDLWEHESSKAELEEYVRGIAIEELTRIVCMDLLAGQQSVTLSEDELSQIEELAEEYYKGLTEDDLAGMGVSQSDVRLAYEHYALAAKVYHSMTMSVDDEVSDDEARVIQVRELVVSDAQSADSIANRLEAGDDFSAIATSYPTTERNVARGDYPQELEGAAFALDNGMCTGMIPVEDEYYFIYCVNKFEPQLTEENREAILFKREKEQFENSYQNILANADFRMNDEAWESILLDEMEESTTDSFFALYEKYFPSMEEQ